MNQPYCQSTLITARYIAPTNTLGSRILVASKHALGRKYYSYDYGCSNPFAHAVAQYLERITKINSLSKSEGWGRVEDWAEGCENGDKRFYVRVAIK